MRKILMLIVTLFAVVVIAGCGGQNSQDNQGNGGEREGGESNKIDYEVVANWNDISPVVQDVITQLRPERGYYIFSPAEYELENTYVLVCSGKKNTGGYDIIPEEVTMDEDNNINLVVKETEPEEDEAVTQAITYPFTLVNLKDIEYEEITVINQEDEEFNHVEPEKKPELIEAEGVYVGRIDNNFVEIKVDGEPMSFKLPSEAGENLTEGEQFAFVYFENEKGQQVFVEKVN